MGAKPKLLYSLKNLLITDRQGSYTSQRDRHQLMLQFAHKLWELGYKIPTIYNLKSKHIVAIVDAWKSENISNGTLKNRLSVIRRLSNLINKPEIVHSNQELGIGNRVYIPVKNKALYNPKLEKISHPYLRVSLELQRVFGLRREESLKIKPHMADSGNELKLQPSWCKGGRGRNVPILTEEQRYWLEKAKEIAGKFGNSLIPPDKNYIQHRYLYDKQTTREGLKNLHGLRHAYAQRRYKELTGWEAPINGGPNSKQLTTEQKVIDHQARVILSGNLGHERISIVKNYCG